MKRKIIFFFGAGIALLFISFFLVPFMLIVILVIFGLAFIQQNRGQPPWYGFAGVLLLDLTGAYRAGIIFGVFTVSYLIMNVIASKILNIEKDKKGLILYVSLGTVTFYSLLHILTVYIPQFTL